MQQIRIIKENETLEFILENFRTNILKLDIKNSVCISVFLVTPEKFERVWNTIFEDDTLIESTKKYWLKLINQKKVLVVEENNKIFPVDIFKIS